jgi:hypothetical protein
MTGSLNHRRLLRGAQYLNKRHGEVWRGSAGRNSDTVWTGQPQVASLLTHPAGTRAWETTSCFKIYVKHLARGVGEGGSGRVQFLLMTRSTSLNDSLGNYRVIH